MPKPEKKSAQEEYALVFSMKTEIDTFVQNLAKLQQLEKEKTDDFDEIEKTYDAARLNFAKMLKYYEYAYAREDKGFSRPFPENEKQRLDAEAMKLSTSQAVETAVSTGPKQLKKLTEVFIDQKSRVIRNPGEFVIALEANGQIRLDTNEDRQREEQHRAGLLADFVEKSASRSFSGRLKSWFVGNSKEYDKAITALKGYANGGVRKETAVKYIKDYLDIRKHKVRDHQYGRDRFQGFMESLETLMEPKEFKEYCDEVNDARKSKDTQYYPRHVQPEQFSPQSDKSVLKGLLAEEQTQIENRKKTDLANEAAQRVKREADAKKYKKMQEEFDKELKELEEELATQNGKTTKTKTEKTTSGKGEPTL